MKRLLAVFGLSLLGLPAQAAAGALDLRLGGFFPRAESNLFFDDTELYTVERDDWRGLTGGAEYRWELSDNFQLGLHLDAYGRSVHTAYRDFVHESGREILQTLKLNVVPVGLTLRATPWRDRRRVTPYAAVGADLFFYQYDEFGEFIDFDDDDLPVLEDSFVSRGVAPGFHVAGGVRVPLTYDIGLVGEARYQFAEDDMGDDFRGNRIDLSGFSATVGVSLRF